MQAQTVEDIAKHVIAEGHEVISAVQIGNRGKTQGEIADVVYSALFLLTAAEHLGYSVSEILGDAIQKLKRRKPFAFEGRTAIMDETWAYWLKSKDEEKNS